MRYWVIKFRTRCWYWKPHLKEILRSLANFILLIWKVANSWDTVVVSKSKIVEKLSRQVQNQMLILETPTLIDLKWWKVVTQQVFCSRSFSQVLFFSLFPTSWATIRLGNSVHISKAAHKIKTHGNFTSEAKYGPSAHCTVVDGGDKT